MPKSVFRTALLGLGLAAGVGRGGGPLDIQTAAPAISVTSEMQLSFGRLIAGRTPGTVTISPAGTRTCIGVYPAGATGFSAASFAVRQTGSGNAHYSITWPSRVTLKGSHGETMTIDGFQSGPPGPLQLPGLGRTDTRTLGATLHVGARQPAGTYGGVLYLTINLGG